MPERLRLPPYPAILKPYGQSLVELAQERDDIVCLSGDLTRQCEIDLFAEAFPERFIHAGMAEANMMGIAGALARDGFVPFVHTFGVFATRRPLDQIINAIAFPKLKVRIMGFMPGVSSPGGPSHQAIDDVALMRAIPNMTVVDVADAVEVQQVAAAIVDVDGPVYVRLKRGEIPLIFSPGHQLSLTKANVLTAGPEPGSPASGSPASASAASASAASGSAASASAASGSADVALFASGMMLASALEAMRLLKAAGVSVSVVNVPVIKPLDTATVTAVAAAAKVVITAENHTIVGGLGSAVAEALAEAGLGRPLRRVGLRDTFAEGSKTGPYLFGKYGLSTQAVADTAWAALGRPGQAPVAEMTKAAEGEYSPV